MLADPVFRETVALLVLVIVVAIAAGGMFRLLTRKSRQRAKLRKFNQTRVRM